MRFDFQIGPNKNKDEKFVNSDMQYSTINGCVYVLNVISYILMELKRFQFPHFIGNQVFSYIVGRTGRKTAAAFFCFQP